ncbi:hypothetical protein ACHAPF_009179 [Botrytis cinerea]
MMDSLQWGEKMINTDTQVEKMSLSIQALASRRKLLLDIEQSRINIKKGHRGYFHLNVKASRVDRAAIHVLESSLEKKTMIHARLNGYPLHSEAAAQSNLPRSSSPSGNGRYTSYPIPSLGFGFPETTAASHITVALATEPQRPSAGVTLHQGIYDIPTTYHTVQGFSSSPHQGHHRSGYPTSEGSFQYTVPQEIQRIGFRTAEGNDAYERYLREAGQIERMAVSQAKPARETWARDIWESEMGKQGGSGGRRGMY